jgi:hypothetical protein
MSCRKDIPSGTVIEASGFVYDSVKNKKLSGVTVFLVGAGQTLGGIYYTEGPLDSVVSDVNGNFSITYTALGRSLDYGLVVGVIYAGDTSQPNFVVDANHPLYKFNYARTVNDVEIYARELNYAQVTLKVLSNPYGSLYFGVTSQNASLQVNQSFEGNPIDTTFMTRILPGYPNYFQFEAINTDSSMVRSVTVTVNPGLTDTISLNQTISSIYDLPVQPN